MQFANDRQVTIPLAISHLVGFTPVTGVAYKFDSGRVWLSKVAATPGRACQQGLSATKATNGCATINRYLRTDDMLRLTRED